MNIFSKFFCRHKTIKFHRNIYGDEINRCDGKRSWWYCDDCGKFLLKDNLVGDNCQKNETKVEI